MSSLITKFSIVSIDRQTIYILFYLAALCVLILRGFACIRAALDKQFPKLAAGVAVVASVLHARVAVTKLMGTKHDVVISKTTIYQALHDAPLIGWLLDCAMLSISQDEVSRLLCQWMDAFNNHTHPFFYKKLEPLMEALQELCEVI